MSAGLVDRRDGTQDLTEKSETPYADHGRADPPVAPKAGRIRPPWLDPGHPHAVPDLLPSERSHTPPGATRGRSLPGSRRQRPSDRRSEAAGAVLRFAC